MIRRICFILPVVAALASCGGSDDSPSGPTSTCLGCGAVTLLEENSSVFSLPSDATEGQQYLILPYVVGDDTVQGGNPVADPALPEVRFSLEASATVAAEAGLNLMQPVQEAVRVASPASTRRAYEHNLRSLWQRFDPHRGFDQQPGFWQSVASMDSATVINDGSERWLGLVSAPSERNLLGTFQQAALRSERQDRSNFASTTSALRQTSGCPEKSDLFVLDPNDFPNSMDLPDALETTMTYVEKSTYCLAILGTLVTESDLSKIEENIATAVQIYSDLYGTDGSIPNGESAKFLPIFFFMDFSDEDLWPQDEKYRLMGIYLRKPSSRNQAPSIFMPLDFDDLEDSVSFESAEEAKQAFHGTIVHELHHAVVNYFEEFIRETEEVDQTPIGLDEGLAHFFEDALGYGESALPLFAGPFLAYVHFQSDPVLAAGVAIVPALNRGASHALLNYLVAQKGGIRFSDGIVDGASPGLGFLKSFLSDNQPGLSGFAQAFTGSPNYDAAWTTALGGFFAALMVDNAEGFPGQASFKTENVQNNLVDTNGGSPRRYGMRYNNFTIDSRLALADVAVDWEIDAETFLPTNAQAASTISLSGEQKMSYYATKPIHHVVVDGKETFTINFVEDYSNKAVALVRIK